MGRFISFFYGLTCYVVFLFTMVYAVGFVSGVAVPKTIDTGKIVPTVEAFAVNLLLICVFAIQHSVMARKKFKQRWKHFVPAALERSTYVLFSRYLPSYSGNGAQYPRECGRSAILRSPWRSRAYRFLDG